MLTETKINRNVKKKKLNGRDNCILLCHHRVATESTPKKKKTSAPEVLQGVGCARPGWGEAGQAGGSDPARRSRFSIGRSPGGCPWIDTGSASILDRKSGPGAHGSCSVSRA